MFRSNVSMDVRMVNAQTALIDIAGEVNGYAEKVMMDAYNQVTSRGAQDIILNFSKLEYMNSSGIGLVVTLLIRSQRQQQRLLVYGLNEHYRQIFELTRLDEAISLFSSEAEALAAARPPVQSSHSAGQ